MDNITVHGIDDHGSDDATLDLDLPCSSKATLETIRGLIADSDNVFASETPEIIKLIKRSGENEEEEELVDLSKVLDEVLEDKDSLYFYIEPFGREEVTIDLKVTDAAMKWINANTKIETKFLVGTSKHFTVSIQ